LTCGSRFLYYNFQKYVFSGSSQGARIWKLKNMM
jgi:hypothetical protein